MGTFKGQHRNERFLHNWCFCVFCLSSNNGWIFLSGSLQCVFHCVEQSLLVLLEILVWWCWEPDGSAFECVILALCVCVCNGGSVSSPPLLAVTHSAQCFSLLSRALYLFLAEQRFIRPSCRPAHKMKHTCDAEHTLIYPHQDTTVCVHFVLFFFCIDIWAWWALLLITLLVW